MCNDSLNSVPTVVSKGGFMVGTIMMGALSDGPKRAVIIITCFSRYFIVE